MKFIHVADCHIGAWRDPKMKQLTHDAWLAFVECAIAEKPDFIILAGDFFNTAIPGIDSLKVAVSGLQKIKDANIPIYAIAGSHDYSPSGKTMLDVLEEAELLRDVMRGSINDEKLCLRWTQDEKTNVKMTGILGKKGSLDRHYYEDLNRDILEQEEGEKIFLFHTSISELKPKELEKMESYPASFLPKGCKYYAGGHVHITEDISLPGYDTIVYPGPLFPASFSELEKLRCGSYCVVEDWKMTRKYITLKQTKNIFIDANNKDPKTVEEEILSSINDAKSPIDGKIVLLRIAGELTGPMSNIDFRRIFHETNSAYTFLKNTTKLTNKEYEEVHVSKNTPDEIEEQLLKEQSGNYALARELMQVLEHEAQDGEKKYEHEERVISLATKVLLQKES